MLNYKSQSYTVFLIFISLITVAGSVQSSEVHRRELVTGAKIQGSNGIRVSPEGLLYVASAVGSRIDVLEPRTGKKLISLGQQQGVFGPDDLAFGPDGLLYWTAFFTGEVMRMSVDGIPQRVARLGPGVNAITFSNDGRLFVSRVFLADELYEVDLHGLQAARLIKRGLGGFNAMAFGPDNYLYGPLWFKGQVARINVDTCELQVIAEGIQTPAAVKFSPQGVLHVLDQHEGELLTVDISTGEKNVIAYPGVGADNLDFDNRGHVYITNSHEGGVSRMLPNGRMRSLQPGGLSMPSGIAINAQGNLVVAATQSLRNYDSRNGKELSVIHASIGDTNTVATPITVSPYGEQLLVSSWFSNTVQIWDPVKQRLMESYQDFQVPLNAIAMGDDIVVAELAGHRVVRRKVDTMELEVLMSGIAIPTGLAYKSGQLYVADWLTGNVYQLMVDGHFMSTPQAIITGLKQPEGLALDEQGRLLVLETGSQKLLRINPLNSYTEILASELEIGLPGVPGLPPSWLLSSLVIDECGKIMITQDVTNSLRKVVLNEGGSYQDCHRGN